MAIIAKRRKCRLVFRSVAIPDLAGSYSSLPFRAFFSWKAVRPKVTCLTPETSTVLIIDTRMVSLGFYWLKLRKIMLIEYDFSFKMKSTGSSRFCRSLLVSKTVIIIGLKIVSRAIKRLFTSVFAVFPQKQLQIVHLHFFLFLLLKIIPLISFYICRNSLIISVRFSL